MKLLKSAWQVLDGNKSIISLFIARILGLEAAKDLLDPSFVAVLQEIVDWITAGAVTLHIANGGLKKTVRGKKA